MLIAIEAFDAVAVGRAKMLEATVLERTVEVITLVVRPVVAEPVVLVDMRGSCSRGESHDVRVRAGSADYLS
ncbi:MAG: hypothetical protein DMG55_18475 [Acidobacteria bacterium]|nr:MAG: hypothetical protein DMG55_18475 [Acidobacteriota bacterium]